MSCSCKKECEKSNRIPIIDPLADWLNVVVEIDSRATEHQRILTQNVGISLQGTVLG